jgi:ADP-ribose pyrophosphatase YjhB (NUDIX family)
VNARGAKTRVYAFYGRLPRWVRVFLIRRMSPDFNVGAMCVVRRQDGAVLLLRNSYRPGWGLPGGMLRRGEEAIDAVTREVREEVGLTVRLDGRPRVAVDGAARRVDVVFSAHLGDARDADRATPSSAEVLEVGWFHAGLLPELHDEVKELLAAVGLLLS